MLNRNHLYNCIISLLLLKWIPFLQKLFEIVSIWYANAKCCSLYTLLVTNVGISNALLRFFNPSYFIMVHQLFYIVPRKNFKALYPASMKARLYVHCALSVYSETTRIKCGGPHHVGTTYSIWPLKEHFLTIVADCVEEYLNKFQPVKKLGIPFTTQPKHLKNFSVETEFFNNMWIFYCPNMFVVVILYPISYKCSFVRTSN